MSTDGDHVNRLSVAVITSFARGQVLNLTVNPATPLIRPDVFVPMVAVLTGSNQNKKRQKFSI